MSKWSKHSDQNKKENMEEQIQTMLEKVLTDEVEESTVGDMTLYSNLVSATENSENDFSSFIKNARRDKKAFTSKPNLMKNQQDEHLSQNVKRFLELENGFSDSPRKKLKTHNCITGAIHRMQNTPQFQDNDLVILEDNVFDLQNQMMVMNINNTESVQSFSSNFESQKNSQNKTHIENKIPQYINLPNCSPYNFGFGDNTTDAQNEVRQIEEFTENVLNGSDRIEEDTYHQMRGMFLKIIKTQNGSRYLQKAIKKTNKEILSLILNEILPYTQELIIDSYANYFCQRFFISIKITDRIRFIEHISPFMADISKNKIGTYPLQAFIEQLNTLEEKRIFLESLAPHIYDLCFDCQGVHVIEKIIICFEEGLVKFIYDLVLKKFMSLANNNNGLCVVKKMIIHCTNPEILSQLSKKIMENCLNLVQNPFGNYAIQVAIDHWKEDYILPIIKLFFNKFGNLSMQKYSSNVIEKCLEKGKEEVITNFVDEIASNHRITDLMKNNYGNYVVQKALKVSTGENKLKLVTSILRYIDRLGDKKLILKWRSIVESHLDDQVNSRLEGMNTPFCLNFPSPNPNMILAQNKNLDLITSFNNPNNNYPLYSNIPIQLSSNTVNRKGGRCRTMSSQINSPVGYGMFANQVDQLTNSGLINIGNNMDFYLNSNLENANQVNMNYQNQSYNMNTNLHFNNYPSESEINMNNLYSFSNFSGNVSNQNAYQIRNMKKAKSNGNKIFR